MSEKHASGTPAPRDHDVTRLLHEWAGGDEQALARLIDLVYPELRRIAAQYLRRERQGHTLQPTALVNEAFLRLAQRPDKQWNDRTHFFAVAARIVRNVLVDHARAREASKRGSGAFTVVLTDAVAQMPAPEVNLLDLDTALKELEQLDPQHSRIVELRYFAGLSIEETAAVVGVSESSVKRDWVLAKTWIRRRMEGGEPHGA
jgi:RNA polymerase sigma factor (TIGR02999 family)